MSRDRLTIWLPHFSLVVPFERSPSPQCLKRPAVLFALLVEADRGEAVGTQLRVLEELRDSGHNPGGLS